MKKNELTTKINDSQKKIEDVPRDYIGASSIGSHCLRQIWYQYKGYKGTNVESRVRRTWAIGSHLEHLIIDWLKKSGLVIETEWLDLVDEELDYFKGHVDSILMKNGKAEAIIEIKTAKNSSFNLFDSKGLRIWNKQYFDQIQSYMGMSGIHKAYILVLNKDNSELADECVLFDENVYFEIKQKAKMVASFVEEPSRINDSPLFYLCKMCKFNKICHVAQKENLINDVLLE